MVAATVDDLQWVEYPADAADDDAPMQGWLLRVVGKGQKEREVPLPADIAEGDYVIVQGMGAYSVVTNSRFNGFGELGMVTVLSLKL